MQVLVTGGAGRIGRVVTARLVRQGYDVIIIDTPPQADIAGATYVQCDITDYDAGRDQIRGCEAVVHLAAYPSPRTVPGHEVFRVNVAGTFNVFEAAAAEGIKRVVQASSINAFGCAWNVDDMVLPYFPVDEDYPRNTNDPYSLSKQMVEDIGDYYWRRDGISSVAMRWPWVWTADYKGSDAQRARFTQSRAGVDEFAALPASERKEQFNDGLSRAVEFRRQRPLEYNPERDVMQNPFASDEWLWRTVAHDRFNFWTYIDVRDVAQAIDKALTANYEGSHPLFVNNNHNWLDYDSNTLLELFYPDVTERKHPIQGSESLVSMERARELIGFEPEHTVRFGDDT